MLTLATVQSSDQNTLGDELEKPKEIAFSQLLQLRTNKLSFNKRPITSKNFCPDNILFYFNLSTQAEAAEAKNM